MKLYKHKSKEGIRYWAAPSRWVNPDKFSRGTVRMEIAEYEILTPYRVSPSEETLPVELSVPSGVFPAKGFEEHYESA